jgi:hypothetical protein
MLLRQRTQKLLIKRNNLSFKKTPHAEVFFCDKIMGMFSPVRVAFFLIVVLLNATLPVMLFAQTPSKEYEEKLRAEEQEVLKQLETLNEQKKKIQGEAASLKRDIALLDSQINEAKLKIRIRSLAIDNLSKDISMKSQTIEELNLKIERSKDSLANLLQKSNEKDDISIAEIMLANKQFSDFFGEADAYQTVSGALKVTLDTVRNFKLETEEEKQDLEVKKDKETDAKQAIEAQQRLIERSQTEKNRLLKITSGQEKAYQQVIVEKERRVAQIRATLFQLRDSDGISFGDAYDYAVRASESTGVRPAFLLAILQQESDLGKNVGNCYLASDDGSGVSVNTGKIFKNVMKPDRDVKPFKQITGDLGLDPFKTRVSCPLSYGYGGAMGPAQFIPSTWQLFKNRIAKNLGVAIPNPWEPLHAFMASSIYLSDLGAGLQEYTAERNAACRYYSGAKCGVRTGSTTYGNQVMARVQNIQENMIDPLLGK